MKEAEAEALTSICWFALAWDGLHLEELGVSHQSLGRLSGAVLATFLRYALAKESTGMPNRRMNIVCFAKGRHEERTSIEEELLVCLGLGRIAP